MRTLPALLLRLVLSIALMLDGSGMAMAGALLQAPATGSASHAMHAHSRHCHAQADAGHGQVTPRHGHGHPMPDCCQPGGCSCACTPTIPAIVGFEWRQPCASLTMPAPLAVGYVAPVRPNLMRPPIA